MLTEERQQAILSLLNEKNIIKTRELMSSLDVSESTIRRDLQEMEAEGILRRVHGGAKRTIKLEAELDMTEKSAKNLHEKNLIGAYAASLVTEGEFIYLDAGTTTYEMLPFLKDKKIHVVTNSVQHASVGIDLGLQITMIGGTIRNTTKAAVSHQAIEQIKMCYFDKAFMGANGVHDEYGYTTVDAEEAAIKKVAMHQAQHVFVLADGTKIDKVNFSKIGNIEEALLITDSLQEDQKERLQNKTTIKEVLK
ncbi:MULTISPECIES: DeoR/GlpR family DNA-binding transcription regulator [Vagococcus]|uniref:Transcriptional repressor of the fructose operon, DeoR family n=1 Tax=Vagococcus fluvialis bH819 TaxID=1255619 RepID=A0A1X6WMX2_9ENTE|nr:MULTISPECIES: DeoR/GlpR family DNA-binding transcription regulator [Vagococcus]SLM85617.1 Transcriptional repressor of the fructose operon, DeoR family [Vagococcus fluvialis bH819]HCM89585.1 DeoR/GlpR transcriptional regulator [Vagococcus sp.]